MTTRTLVFTVLLAGCTAAAAIAQPTPQPTPAQAPRARGSVPAPEAQMAIPPPPTAPPVAGGAVPRVARAGQPINIKIEFTLKDQRAGSAPITRTVSLIVADQHTGQIRSQSDVVGIGGGVPLNVDTTPELLSDGKVRIGFSLQYNWASLESTNPPVRGTVLQTAIHDSVSIVLESGKPMIAAQSADPIGDRQVTVEVKATILR
jgi:hypothetical protein